MAKCLVRLLFFWGRQLKHIYLPVDNCLICLNKNILLFSMINYHHLFLEFTALGVGFCQDAAGESHWKVDNYCVSALETCQEFCLEIYNCVCVSFSANPNTNVDGCQNAEVGHCILYLGTTSPALSSFNSGYMSFGILSQSGKTEE